MMCGWPSVKMVSIGKLNSVKGSTLTPVTICESGDTGSPIVTASYDQGTLYDSLTVRNGKEDFIVVKEMKRYRKIDVVSLPYGNEV